MVFKRWPGLTKSKSGSASQKFFMYIWIFDVSPIEDDTPTFFSLFQSGLFSLITLFVRLSLSLCLSFSLLSTSYSWQVEGPSEGQEPTTQNGTLLCENYRKVDKSQKRIRSSHTKLRFVKHYFYNTKPSNYRKGDENHYL